VITALVFFLGARRIGRFLGRYHLCVDLAGLKILIGYRLLIGLGLG
jgi:hypothetical protein